MALPLLIFSGCKVDESEQTDLGLLTPFFHVPQKFNGKIREITIIGYWAEVNGTEVNKGKQLSSEELDSLNLINHFHIEFDESGNVLGYSYLDDHNKPFLSYSYEINDGLPVSGSYTEADGGEYKQKIVYDDEGNIVEIRNILSDKDSVINCRRLEYPEKGRYSSIKICSGTGDISRYANYIWNDSGLIIRVERFANTGQFSGGLDNNYGDDGFLKSQTIINADKSVGLLYEFRIEKKDKHGNPLLVTNLHDGEVVFVDEYSYIYY